MKQGQTFSLQVFGFTYKVLKTYYSSHFTYLVFWTVLKSNYELKIIQGYRNIWPDTCINTHVLTWQNIFKSIFGSQCRFPGYRAFSQHLWNTLNLETRTNKKESITSTSHIWKSHNTICCFPNHQLTLTFFHAVDGEIRMGLEVYKNLNNILNRTQAIQQSSVY